MVVLVVLLVLLAGLAILVIGYWWLARGRAAEDRLGVPVESIRAADVGVKVPLNCRVEKTLISSIKQKVSQIISPVTMMNLCRLRSNRPECGNREKAINISC